jgi:hypothetical protein
MTTEKNKSTKKTYKNKTATTKHKARTGAKKVVTKHKGKGYVPSVYSGGKSKANTKGTVTKTKWKKDAFKGGVLKKGATPIKTKSRKATRKKYK